MYKILLHGVTNKHEYEELIKVFLQPSQYLLLWDGDSEQTFAEAEQQDFSKEIIIKPADSDDKNDIKRQIYFELSELTGLKPEWGIMIGVRPVKVARIIVDNTGSFEAARKRLIEFFLLSEEKADLILNILKYQQKILDVSPQSSVGIYIGIPFCPTRCLYCSFASNQVEKPEIDRYLQALHKEIDFVAQSMKQTNMNAESVYIGGGTPTTLDEMQLAQLLDKINQSFDMTHVKEFTVEAGRPDTITEAKLRTLKEKGVGRISINPQSMKDKTLELIGRNHNSDDIRRAFRMAKAIPGFSINADIITGLPEETPEDFIATLKEILELGADNITVHTLAVKRASRLIDVDPSFHYKQAETVRQMLDISKDMLKTAGYTPYYLYRQKHMAGAYENTGYCLPGMEGIYNIRVMDEAQTIIALGAGGISKAYDAAADDLSRVPNVINYEIYIERIDEMMKRKRDNIFGGKL